MDIKMPMTTEKRNVVKEKLCDLESVLKSLLRLRNTFGDRIEIRDEVLIWEGEGENRKLKFKTRGHIVNQGLIGLVNLMSCTDIGNIDYVPSYLWGTDGTIRVGIGLGATTSATTSLVSESPVAPSSVSGATSNPSTGIYRCSWLATWVAGSLTAITVTEFALKLYLTIALSAFGATPLPNPTANAFTSRISSTDGDFTAFIVNIAVPLVIEWRWTFSFV